MHINENFAKLAEALYIADRKAREAVEMRAQIEKKLAQKEKEKREENLRQLAQKAREERAGIRRVDGLYCLIFILFYSFETTVIFVTTSCSTHSFGT